MRPTILCARPTCTAPATTVCEACTKKLCVRCYGAGSSSRCGRCFDAIRREQVSA